MDDIGNNDDYGIEVHSFEKSASKKIFIHVQEFKGKTYLDLREFYSKDDAWKPSRKGITVPPELYPELLTGIAQAAELLGIEVDDEDA